jgi:hypothetical protein
MLERMEECEREPSFNGVHRRIGSLLFKAKIYNLATPFLERV